jgi:hypothetical protein
MSWQVARPKGFEPLTLRFEVWGPGHAVQSNAVSESFLQKMATLPKMRGDFRHRRKKNIEYGTQRFSA